jgi:hypothetical protein
MVEYQFGYMYWGIWCGILLEDKMIFKDEAGAHENVQSIAYNFRHE